ncbi:pro-FMRFamide-related neuropeptide VF [Cavia porcellus]|uniref:pro-FMRFamide-related neuropeptide VF n=1 Tax=Cavia porcellus TaxID=10141 RepID=UPI000C879B1B|nr:pro-FMRFamide-related neuropeptide VF [Cavia porcellus]
MEIISSKRFILLTLATSILLTSNIFYADELTMGHLHSKENYDKCSEPQGTPKGEKERSFTFQELKDWGPKNVMKMSTPAVNKTPHAAANLPLRFGRTMKEERNPRGSVNLPLRFGRNMEAGISRHLPNLPQRFGRMTMAKSASKTLSNLLRRSMHSLSANELLHCMTCQSEEI